MSKNIMAKLRLVEGFVEPEKSMWKGYVLCPQCSVGFNQEVRKMSDALNNCGDVELVSINYKGRKRYWGNPISIKTQFYKERAEAEKELQTLARYYGCDMVINVERHREEEDEETDSGGTYTYSVWSYSGKAVRRVY